MNIVIRTFSIMNNKQDLSVIILTLNEELHIRRCVENALNIAKVVYVIDSFSTDRTCEIASSCGAVVHQNKYVNQAQQFQWALDNCQVDTEWVMRMDADEYLTDELIAEIKEKLTGLRPEITGVNLTLRVRFLGHILRFGNLRPVCIMRIWRTGSAYMEQRWMDERLVLKEGECITFKHRFIDDNLNGLTEWTQKHNNYSNREILVQLDKRYHLFDQGADESLIARNRQKGMYYRMPKFFRAFAYFTLRYIFFLGFLDGVRGLIWLTLQAYWYRFLVDSKLYEMEKRLGKNPSKEEVVEYIRQYFKIDIPA